MKFLAVAFAVLLPLALAAPAAEPAAAPNDLAARQPYMCYLPATINDCPWYCMGGVKYLDCKDSYVSGLPGSDDSQPPLSASPVGFIRQIMACGFLYRNLPLTLDYVSLVLRHRSRRLRLLPLQMPPLLSRTETELREP
jgi:hypothetical protein